MKKFIKNIFLFSTALVVISSFVLLTIHFIQKNNHTLNYSVENKIQSFNLDSEKLNIVIAGDSRAERQLLPKVFEDEYHCNSFNIATSSCDLVSTVSSIKKHYKNSKDEIIFIISASSFQINDGAVDLGYLSPLALSKLTIGEKLKLYSGKYASYFALIKRGLIAEISNKLNLLAISKKLVNTKGVALSEGKLKTNLPYTSHSLNKHPWYKDISINGARKRIFEEAFTVMGNMQYRFIIIQPPISPYFRKSIKETAIEEMEKNYSKFLNTLALEYQNIEIFDFYINDTKTLADTMYYDPQHLNKDGALIFSKLLASKIRNNARTHNNVYKK
jgi:hypothetical protein